MIKDKSIKKGIIASVISSVIFMIFLQPLMKLIWSMLNSASLKFYSSFLDSIFRNAALGHRNHIDFQTYSILLILFLGAMIIGLIRLHFFIKKECQKPDIENKTDEELENEINNIETSLTKLYKVLNINRIVGVVLIVIYFFTLTSTLFTEYSNIQLNTTFNQRLNALAPYLDNNQDKMLKSKWALMKSKSDYIEIKETLEIIAERNEIELPKELIEY